MKLKNILYLLLFVTLNASAQVDSVVAADNNDSLAPPAYRLISEKRERNSNDVYHLKKAIDYPVTAVLGGTTIYLMTIIYSKSPTPEADILKLNKDDLPAIDRWTAGWHDDNLDKISYYPFYAVMPLPLLFFADKKISKDMGTVGPLYLEASAVYGIIYASSVFFVDRFRPDVYNTSLSMDYRTNGNYRNSFFAGHVGLVANTTFFMSSVYMSYHPESHLKWVLYGGSAAATLGMAYLRLEAGKHFTSDIIVGIAVGTACGLLTPALHKNKEYKHQKWSLAPSLLNNGYREQLGFTFAYKLR